MTTGSVRPRTPDEFRAAFDGDVLTKTDAGYAEARSIFNGAIDSQPALIARCAGVSDVHAALEYARTQALPLAVRGGGHSVAGASLVQDGVVIDMRGLNSVHVDPQARTVTAGGGTVWGELDSACQPHGLTVTGGRVSTTGVVGLALGGGSGWVERKFGLTIDNLLSVDLITADGREVTANESENPELFWALHGGGGNFGIVTSLTLRLHPLPAFSIALLLWPGEHGRDVVHVYRDLLEDAPDEIGGAFLYLTGPPEEFVPEHLVNTLCAGVLVTCTGTEADLREHIGNLLALGPEGAVITEIPYAELQSMLDDPPGFRNYWSADYLHAMPEEALERFCDTANLMVVPSPSQHVLLPWGGAVARNAGNDAMNDRTARWVVHPLGLWEDPADDERARHWAREVGAQMQPWASGAIYLNFIGDEGADRVVAGFGRANYDRLAQVKAVFDPDNVFNRWHNVLPAKQT